MFLRIPSRSTPLIAGLALLLAPCAHALEHVTLTNGFSVDCAHHEVIDNRIRLYIDAGTTNFQELPTAQVSAIDTLPDPPPTIAATTSTPTVAKPASVLPNVAEMREMIVHAGAAHNIDVDLLASVIKTESNFQVNAVSRAGARGLMQLMPGTARDLGVQDVTRADQNINGGTAYLDSLLKLYNDDISLALAAYNAGPAAVARYHNHVPPYRETQAYVARVIREFNRCKTQLAKGLAQKPAQINRQTNVASR